MRANPSLIGWYYTRDGRHLGPLTVSEVARLLRSGGLRPTGMLVEIAEAAAPGEPEVRYDYLDAKTVADRSRQRSRVFAGRRRTAG